MIKLRRASVILINWGTNLFAERNKFMNMRQL